MAAPPTKALGIRLPVAPPPVDPQNPIRRAYSADGRQFILRDAAHSREVLTHPAARLNLATAEATNSNLYPIVIDLNVPYAIGTRPLHILAQVALAFQIDGLQGSLTRCTTPPPYPMSLHTFGKVNECVFTHYMGQLPQAATHNGGAKLLAMLVNADLDTVSLFPQPYLVVLVSKTTEPVNLQGTTPTMERQKFFARQYCTNCLAARNVIACTHFFTAEQFRVQGNATRGQIVVPVDTQSQLDHEHGPSVALDMLVQQNCLTWMD